MSARIVEGIFTCTKRWALENALENVQKTRRNQALKLRLPMSGIEHVLRILCWIDTLDDPSGRLYDKSVQDVELAAHWDGPPGALVSALIATGWIDVDEAGMRWHDYFRMNGNAIADRNKKRKNRDSHPPGCKGDKRGDNKGDKTGDKTGDSKGDNRGASGSGSGSGGILTDSPPLSAGAAAGPSGPPPCAAPTPPVAADPPPVVWQPPKPMPGLAIGPIRRRLAASEDAP